MHNFDLDISPAFLEEIEGYFGVLINPGAARNIVNSAYHHQGLLPRRAQTGLYRLPQVGTIIATSHANITAQNYFSALCVLPFILPGSGSGVGVPGVPRALFDLLGLIMSYAELQHFARRVNMLPWHIHETFHDELQV